MPGRPGPAPSAWLGGLASRSGSSAGVPSIAGGEVSTDSSAVRRSAPVCGRWAGLRASVRWIRLTRPIGSVGRRWPRSVGVALEPRERGVGVGLAEERHTPGEALVEHERQRVEVGAPVEALAANLLGREVLGGAHHHVVAGEVVAGGEALGDAEVGQQHATVGRDEDVAGLDVAVDEAGAVGLVEGAGDGGADVDRQLGPEPLLGVEQLAQALAVDELHHDRLAAVVDEDVVDADDVGVAEPGDGDRLAAEALGDDGVGGERWCAAT